MLGILSFIKLLYYVLNSFFTLVLLYYIGLIFLPNLPKDCQLLFNYVYYNVILRKEVEIPCENIDDNIEEANEGNIFFFQYYNIIIIFITKIILGKNVEVVLCMIC